MGRNLSFPRVFILMVAASLACNLLSAPAGGPTGSTEAPAQASPTASPAATAEAGEEDESSDPLEAPLVEEPPRASMLELVEDKAASGEWTRGEGLIAGLKVLAGEQALADAFGEAVITSEGTGIIQESVAYLAQASDPDIRAEIERLLAIVAPAPERLLEYARPESGQGGRAPGSLAAPASAVKCEDIFEEGFPSGQGLLCLEYTEQNLGTYKGRIFYPSWWGESDPQYPYLEAARQAVADSWNLYSLYGEMRAIDMIFTIIGFQPDPSTAVAQIPDEEKPGQQRCLIVMYPNSMQSNLASFKQTVAHEMFHCYQMIHFPAHFGQWGLNHWWGEATAEYFSNLVYPGVNDEWKFAPSFDWQSDSTPIFGMSYENFEFFQHLGNTVGEAGIFALISSLPPSGSIDGHRQALAAYPLISQVWHQFGRLYVDGKIKDTSGAFIPRGWPDPLKDELDAPSDKAEIAGIPFALPRRLVYFNPKHLYHVTVSEAGAAGNHGERLATAGSPWSGIPSIVAAACGKPAYIVLATTTSASSDVYEVTVEAKASQEDVDCDQCLVGGWDLDLEAFKAYVGQPFAGMGDFYTFLNAGGIWHLSFHSNGILKAAFNFAYAYALKTPTEGQTLLTEGIITLDGQGIAMWWVSPPATLTMASVKKPTFESIVTINGEFAGSTTSGDFSGFGSALASQTYTCTPTTLTMFPPGSTADSLPVVYTRTPP